MISTVFMPGNEEGRERGGGVTLTYDGKMYIPVIRRKTLTSG